ncbi:ImmA/IrrE family metallo-endopeptidase [Mammaliicoccus sciuri]|uniref:ImmA/IrrE family metallo-endopeptidase n=2 Tax=Mammaliicoccus sciuri TaxID=1296 RepID=UPI0034DD8E44
MRIEYQQSFVKVAKKVKELSEEKNVIAFPLPIIDIISSDDSVELMTYNDFANINKCSKGDVKKYGNSNEAFHFKTNNKSFIVYNDDIYYKRLRFTLAHEYGHVKLKHKGTSLHHTKTFHDQMRINLEEYEANTFASCLLFPLNLRYKYHECLNIDEIAELFEISYSAAKIAMKILDDHMCEGLDEFISVYEHNQYSTYISYLEELLQDKIEYTNMYKEEMEFQMLYYR